MHHYDQFKRYPTQSEIDQLATEYNEHHNCIDGKTEARFGNESHNEALKLVRGDEYSLVDYSPRTDSFFWIHDAVLAKTLDFDANGSPVLDDQYDAVDAGCDRYHDRKDCL